MASHAHSLGTDRPFETPLIAGHGWQAMMDGGLHQLVELLLTGYASVAAYVVLKACEYSLVRRITTGSDSVET
jgi:hypothetical protein